MKGAAMPKAATEVNYIVALADACGPEDWAEIVAAIVARAKGGDIRAADFLAKQLLAAGAPSITEARAKAFLGERGMNPVARAVERMQLEADRDRLLDVMLAGGWEADIHWGEDEDGLEHSQNAGGS
jgi:hypothetical protein